LSFGSLTSATLGGLTGPGTLSLANASSSAVALSVGNNNASTTFAGALNGPGSLTKVGSGALLLSGSNTYSGGTTVSAGTMQLGDGSANNGYVQGNILDNGAVVFANPALQTYSKVISGTGLLTKIGTGTLDLTGSNTYSGPTTIIQGKLSVDGWLTNSAVSVNSGGTLGGTGYLSSVTVNAGGNLAPGDPKGALHLSGNLNLASGAAMDYDLDGILTDNEVLMPTGQLILSDQQFANFDITPQAGFYRGTYILIDAGSISGSLGTNLSGTVNGLPATLAVQGNELVLNVVPEPSTATLLGAGVLVLLGWTRRRAWLHPFSQPRSRRSPRTR
jgi:autotransporter-associated beta strand protein